MTMYVPYLVQKKKGQWKVNIDLGLYDELKKWMEKGHGEKHGYNSIANFVTDATREKFEEVKQRNSEVHHYRFKNKETEEEFHLTVFHDHIQCNICESRDCKHIKTVYQDKSIKKLMEEDGIKIPSRNVS